MIGKVNLQTIRLFPSNLHKEVTEQKSPHQNPQLNSSLPIYAYKPITFSGNINPVSNFDTISDALNFPTYKQLNSENLLALPVDEFAKKAISQIFKNDRDFLDKHYLSDFSSYDKYSKLGFIDENLNLPDAIKEFLENTNQRKLAIDYTKFFDENLKSLEKVAKGQYQYTNLFLDKKVGDKNLVDFWLSNLGIENVSNQEKINVLNKSLADIYQKNGNVDDLVVKTIEEYFSHIIKSKPQNTEDVDFNKPLNDLLNIKNKLNKTLEDGSVNKREFAEIINNEELMTIVVDDKSLKSILLSQLNNPMIEDVSSDLQNEFLSEILDDDNLRNQVVKNTLSLIRKKIIDIKTKNEKQSTAINNIENENLNDFDKSLVSKLFAENTNTKAKQIVNDINLFKTEVNRIFKQITIYDPFTSKDTGSKINEKNNIIFTLVNDSILSVKDTGYLNHSFAKLSDLTFALNSDNKKQANKLWNNDILNIAITQWNQTHLPKIIKELQQNYIILENFLKKEKSKELIQTGIIESFFNSNIVTVEQKAFLANKEGSTEFISLCNFLVNHVPNNQGRKEIINKLIETERLTLDSFDMFKKYFIDDVRNNNINSTIYNKKIQGNKLCDLVISKLTNSINIYNEQEKIEFLNKITDEDISAAFNEIKDIYLEQQFNQTVKTISDKYDFSKQAEQILNNLQINVNGKTYTLFNVINEDFKYLESILNKNNVEQQKKIDEALKLLSIDTELSARTYKVLNAMLDKMIAESPANRNALLNEKSNLDKIFNVMKKSASPLGYATISAIVYENPFAFIPAVLTTILNICDEFK